VLVAGDIGPSGKLLAMGEIDEQTLVDAFAEQAAALAEGGVDLFHVETMSDLAEARAAVEGVRRVSDRPLLLTMSFDTGKPEGPRTMMGVTPSQLVELARELGVFGVGVNCGRGLEGYQEVVRALADARPEGVLVAKLNAGIPRMEGTQVVYDGTPERMAEYARWCAENGVAVIGACCGSTPRHIEAMRRAVSAFKVCWLAQLVCSRSDRLTTRWSSGELPVLSLSKGRASLPNRPIPVAIA
jgi:5-methyltetrahydrofolate--homocysteine methyltransferase